MLNHVLSFIISAIVLWFFTGILIESVDHIAKRFRKTGFAIAFLVLGIFTSISEMSVAANSLLAGVPQVSVGNIIGASMVLLFLVVPFLAIGGKGVNLRGVLSKTNLIITLFVIFLPVFLVMDGSVSWWEGILAILAYLVLLRLIYWEKDTARENVVRVIEEASPEGRRLPLYELIKIIGGGVAVFIAGYFLVNDAVYFAQVLNVPGSIIGLLLLSVGTNIPEITIAIRSIFKKHKDIALGDYLGSASANTFIFGTLAVLSNNFTVGRAVFIGTGILMAVGLITFFRFSKSQKRITREEGLILLIFYLAFVIVQALNLTWIHPQP